MTEDSLLQQLSAPENRADPYPVFAEMRKSPVSLIDGMYVVSTYDEITALLHDPRISSDPHTRDDVPADAPPADFMPFILRDAPDHDRMRRLTMRHFGPPDLPRFIAQFEPIVQQLVDELLDALADRRQFDVVDDFAYPLPVTVICRLLGVPLTDEQKIHEWADALVGTLNPDALDDPQAAIDSRRITQAEIVQYFGGLVDDRVQSPQDDMISRMANDTSDDVLTKLDIQITCVMLLVAGHETTVNLIANGVLTLLRNPALIQDLRADRGFAIPLFEELLRFEPPVQFQPARSALSAIDIAGVTIPEGAHIQLMFAAGSRDPGKISEPDRFNPRRADNQHFGFGGGLHYCFGAPLARLEGQVALYELFRRVEQPKLVVDPPPYRESPILRGPRHLMIDVEGITA